MANLNLMKEYKTSYGKLSHYIKILMNNDMLSHYIKILMKNDYTYFMKIKEMMSSVLAVNVHHI